MLFKNAFNTLKKRYFQLILLGIIILLSSFIYTAMSYAIGGTEAPTDQYLENYQQEDFAVSILDVLFEDDVNYLLAHSAVFQNLDPSLWPYTLSGVKNIDETSYYELLENRTSQFEATYDHIKLDIRESKDVYFNYNGQGYRIRVLKDMTDINQSYIVEGVKPETNNEIAVAEIFAKKNDLAIGDSLTIHDQMYTITGFVLFPDYSLSMFGQQIIIDNKTQTIALLSDQAFENLNETVQFEGAGIFLDGYTEDQFKSDVIDTYSDDGSFPYITGITLTINNMRSGAIYTELTAGRGMSIFISLLIASIALMIVGIVVSRIIRSQRSQIGILKALGYTNREIAMPYLIDVGMLSLIMIIAGYFLGYVMAYPLMQIYLEFYLIPYQTIVQNFQTIFISIIVPFTFIVSLSYVVIMRLLKQEPLTLLNPEVVDDSNKFTKVASKLLKKTKITTKLQQLLLLRSPMKVIVFIIGMFFAGFLVLFTFGMNGLFDRMIYDVYDRSSYEHIGYLAYDEDYQLLDDQDMLISINNVIINGEDASIIGMDSNSTLSPLYNEKGDMITMDLDDGIIISESIKLTRGYDIGDTLTIGFGDQSYTDEVVGISYDFTGNVIYINREDIGQAFFNEENYFNMIYSESELDSNDFYLVIDVSDIIEQANSMNQLMQTFVFVFIGVSISIGVMIIYILTSMAIEDQYYNISLFKVMGYNQKEINHIILGGYMIYGLIIFIVVIPIAIIGFNFMEVFFAQFYDLLFPMKFYWWHAIISIVIYFIIFYLSSLTSKNKLDSISLQETMKIYEE